MRMHMQLCVCVCACSLQVGADKGNASSAGMDTMRTNDSALITARGVELDLLDTNRSGEPLDPLSTHRTDASQLVTARCVWC